MNYAIYRLYPSFEGTREGREGSSNENGPKRCQTHRLGHKYVFFLFHVLCILTNLFLLYLGMKKAGVGSSNENGPKRHVWTCCLGHKYVYFILFRTNYVFFIIFRHKDGPGGQRQQKRAQTTH